MSLNRRRFMSSIAGVLSAGSLASVSSPSVSSPARSMSPIRSQTHNVKEMKPAGLYVVDVEWVPFNLSTATSYRFQMFEEWLEDRYDEVLRDPLEVYSWSQKNGYLAEYETGYEQHFSQLSKINFIEELELQISDSNNRGPPPSIRPISDDDDKTQEETAEETVEEKGSNQVVIEEVESVDKLGEDNTDSENISSVLREVQSDSYEAGWLQSEFEGMEQPKYISKFDSVERDVDVVPDERYLVQNIVRFVQQFTYKTDYERGLLLDYPQYPIETLYFGVGDCEDTTILLAALLENLSSLDIRTAIVLPPAHSAVIAAIPDLPMSERYETYTTIDGVPYTYFETTKPTDLYGQPGIADSDPMIIYKDGEVVRSNEHMLPSFLRGASQLLRDALETYL